MSDHFIRGSLYTGAQYKSSGSTFTGEAGTGDMPAALASKTDMYMFGSFSLSFSANMISSARLVSDMDNLDTWVVSRLPDRREADSPSFSTSTSSLLLLSVGRAGRVSVPPLMGRVELAKEGRVVSMVELWKGEELGRVTQAARVPSPTSLGRG